MSNCATCNHLLKPISDGRGFYCPRCLTAIDHDSNPLGGLHRVGDNPWDYVYQPAEGQKVMFVDVDGSSFTGTISSFEKNRETHEIRLELGAADV